MKPLFCPRCHKRVNIPNMFKGGNIKVEKGVKLKCSDEKCSGVIKYKPETIKS